MGVCVLALQVLVAVLVVLKYLVLEATRLVVVLYALHLDEELLLLLADATKERIVDDLGEEGKRISGFLLVKVRRVHDAVLNPVRHHLLFEDVVGEVGLLGEIVGDVKEALPDVV